MKGFKKSSLVRSLSGTSASSGGDVPATPATEVPTSPPIPEEKVPELVPPEVSEKTAKERKPNKSTKAESIPPPPDPVRTEEYVLAAEERMAEIEILLSEIRTKKAKMTNEIARKIFQAVGSTMPVLEAVASLHPISDNVFKVFQAVYSLEKKRQDHDEDIADVFYSATIAMWSLHHLSKLAIETDMKSKFEGILKKVETTMTDLGQYVVKYYTQNKAVRLMTINGATSNLEGFKAEFDSQKVELQWFIDTHTAVATQRGLAMTQNKLDKLMAKVETQSESSKKLVENYRKGREQLNQMQENFTAQFNTIIFTIKESNAETRDAIIKRLDEGPHELIQEMGMKLVWKEMGWKNSIKCRHFLDAVQDSFFKRFATKLKDTSNFHQDQWTLDILSKSIFYPVIGDAIDSDSSGFVSVTELNDFLSSKLRPDNWSVAEWLAFWAVGWSQCNQTYRARIHDKWNEITAKTSGLVVRFGQDHQFTRFINETGHFIKNTIGVPEEDYEEELLGADVEAELHRLNTKYRRVQEEMLAENLANNSIQEQEDVVQIIAQPRIELSLMPLIYVWISSFEAKIDATAGEDTFALLTHEYSIARRTLDVMLNRRLSELVQIWSQQKEHLPTQISGFCGGIFESYYETVFAKARAEKRANKLKAYRT